jgi:hypothetical protein
MPGSPTSITTPPRRASASSSAARSACISGCRPTNTPPTKMSREWLGDIANGSSPVLSSISACGNAPGMPSIASLNGVPQSSQRAVFAPVSRPHLRQRIADLPSYAGALIQGMFGSPVACFKYSIPSSGSEVLIHPTLLARIISGCMPSRRAGVCQAPDNLLDWSAQVCRMRRKFSGFIDIGCEDAGKIWARVPEAEWKIAGENVAQLYHV